MSRGNKQHAVRLDPVTTTRVQAVADALGCQPLAAAFGDEVALAAAMRILIKRGLPLVEAELGLSVTKVLAATTTDESGAAVFTPPEEA